MCVLKVLGFKMDWHNFWNIPLVVQNFQLVSFTLFGQLQAKKRFSPKVTVCASSNIFGVSTVKNHMKVAHYLT